MNNLGAVKWDTGAHSGTTIENNIVVVQSTMTPSYLLQANSTSGITLDHNLWYAPSLAQAFIWGDGAGATDHAGWVTASGQGAGDVLANPAFVGTWTAPPATNLELAMGSPAIDTGATLAAVTHDFLGAPRPHGAGYDIGAFEYGSTPADGGAAVGPVDAGGAATAEAGPAGEEGGAGSGPDASGGAAGGDSGEGSSATPGADGGAAKSGASGSSSGCACSSAGAPERGSPALWLAAAALWLVRRGKARGRTARRRPFLPPTSAGGPPA